MQELKKTFTKAEVEVIRFEKTDVIATSGNDDTVTGWTPDPMSEEED